MSLSWFLLILAVSVCFITWVSIKYLIDYLRAKNLVDQPNERTLHQGAVPRGGGIVIVSWLIVSLTVSAFYTGRFSFFIGLASLIGGWAWLAWSDDRKDLSPRFRLITQLVLAVLTVFMFGWVNHLGGLVLGWSGAVLTVIGIVWLANLYNFMDGMDGLAASQSIIGAITLGFWFYMAANHQLAITCLVVAASSYGFLLWNWQPAKIFMGDVGSISLGAFFATMIVLAENRHDFPVISLMLIFAVFISDATITIVLRALRKEKIWLPHRSHFYQRLANIGVSHKKIVSAAIFMMLICSLIATITVLYRDMMETS